MIIEQNIMVSMRDGVRLAVDSYRPARAGRFPVLLTRHPYNKDRRFPHLPERRVFLELSLNVERTVAAGYAIVAQDNRGRYASEGEFTQVVDYRRFLPNGRLDAILTTAALGDTPRILLEERMLSELHMYEVGYTGPGHSSAVELVGRTLDTNENFAGPP